MAAFQQCDICDCVPYNLNTLDVHTIGGTGVDELGTYVHCSVCDTIISDQEICEYVLQLQQTEKALPPAALPEYDTVHSLATNSDVQNIYEQNAEDVYRCILQKACICGNSQPDLFESVECPKEENSQYLRVCKECGELSGIDDSLALSDLEDLLKDAHMEATPCLGCGNTDPEKFVFEEDEESLRLLCLGCQEYVEGDDQAYEEDPPIKDVPAPRDKRNNVPDTTLNCTCGNTDQNLLLVSCDPEGYPYMMHCAKCNKDFPIKYTLGVRCYCGNSEQKRFNYSFEGDELKFFKCLQCDRKFNPKEWLRLARLPSRRRSNILPMTRIFHIDDLNVGDHITWHRDIGYWHHAIVSQLGYLSRELKVIEYTGPMKRADWLFFLPGGEIMEHWINTDPVKDELYRVDYSPDHCFPVNEVLAKARSRIGEKDYCILQNNCEHFAKSCKVGRHQSSQVKSFKDVCREMAVKGAFIVANKIILEGLSVASDMIPEGIKELGCYAAKMGLVSVAKQEGKVIVKATGLGSRAFSGAAIVCIEVASLLRNIHQHRKAYLRGEICHETYVQAVIKRGTTSATTLAGTAIGSIAVPIPVVGGIAGATLGHIVGPYLGRKLIHLRKEPYRQ